MEVSKTGWLQMMSSKICRQCFPRKTKTNVRFDEDISVVKNVKDKRLKMIFRILRFQGFHFISNDWKISLRFVLFITLLLTTYIRDIYCFFGKLMEGDLTVPEYVEVLTFMQTQSITAYRIWLMIRHRKRFRKLISYILEKFPSWINGTTQKILEEESNTGMWIYWAHSVQLVTVLSLLVVRPLLSYEQNALLMRPPLGTLPFMPTDVTPWYEITYLIQAWKVIVQVSIAFSMNMLFFTVCIRTCAHMDCVAKDLEAIMDNPTPDMVSNVIREFVDHYNTTREFVDHLNDLFYVLTAVQPLYTGVSVITSLLVFDGTEQSYSFAGIAIAHVLELFIYCFAGDLAAEKSLALSDKLFEVQWYDLQQKDKRSILFAIHQCQKPFKIKAGFFGNFSRHMFTMTMKTTYSTWAVAKQIK